MAIQEIATETLLSSSPRARAVRSLRQWIQDGILPADERLPAEQALADRLSISRPTVRAALHELEAEGLIRSLDRRGWVVARGRGDSVLAGTVAILTDAPHERVQNWQKHGGWQNYIQEGAMGAIRNAGLHALALHPDRLTGKQLERFIAEPPAGVLALRRATARPEGMKVLAALKHGRVPVVVYGDGSDLDVYDTVCSNHEAGSNALTRFLIERGCRRILCYRELRPEDAVRPAWVGQRDAGYERAMRQAGLEPLPAVEYHLPYDIGETRTAAEFQFKVRLMMGFLGEHLQGSGSVDAIMAISDGLLFPIAAACRLLGRQPNRDVMLVGYDNYWEDCPERAWETTVPLATVDKLNERIGQELVDLLQGRKAGKLPEAPQHRVIQPKLVVVGEDD